MLTVFMKFFTSNRLRVLNKYFVLWRIESLESSLSVLNS